MMASQVFTAAQMRVAIQGLLRRQGDRGWSDLVVVYEPDKPTSPLSIDMAGYARFAEADVVCTTDDLHNYRGTGTIDGLVALLTHRIELKSLVTLQGLRIATDAGNITEVLTAGNTKFDANAELVRYAFAVLRQCRGYDMQWACQPGRGTAQKQIVLEFFDGKVHPDIRIRVNAHRPPHGFERRTILRLAEVRPQVRIEIGDSTTRLLSGAVAVAFARSAWTAYMEYILAAVLRQDMP